MIDDIRALLVDITGREELRDVGSDAPLLHDPVGLGSLGGVRLLRAIHEHYGVDIAAEDLNLDALTTLDTLVTYITEHTAPPAGHPDAQPAGSDVPRTSGPGGRQAVAVGRPTDAGHGTDEPTGYGRGRHPDVVQTAEPGDGQDVDFATLRKLEAYTPKKLYLVDATYGDSPILGDVTALAAAAHDAVTAAGGHVMKDSHVVFPNGAITLVMILAESHLSIHTWPEEHLVAIDLFSCGAIEGHIVLDRLGVALGLGVPDVREIDRG